MSAHRFFLIATLPDDPSAALPLSEADARHALRVLRIEAGEIVELVEPDGVVWRVRVTHAGAGVLAGERVERLADATGGGPRVTLFQGVAKGEKMDAIVRQATEVGAEAIVPLFTSRTVVKLVGRKAAEKVERWQRVAKAAAEQSHAARVPEVAPPVDVAQARELLGAYDVAVVLWEECRERSLSEALAPVATHADARVALLVGPEGGFSAEEVAAFEAAGAVAASLGPRILRTETAAVVALALAMHALGELGGATR